MVVSPFCCETGGHSPASMKFAKIAAHAVSVTGSAIVPSRTVISPSSTIRWCSLALGPNFSPVQNRMAPFVREPPETRRAKQLGLLAADSVSV